MSRQLQGFLSDSGFQSDFFEIKNYRIESDVVVLETIEESKEVTDVVEAIEVVDITEEDAVELEDFQEESKMSENNVVEVHPEHAERPDENWTCEACGFEWNTGKFCKSCGKAKQENREKESWECIDCGTENTRNFCYHCGRKKPIKVTNYRCAACGWTPDEDETFQPNYCPECGDKIEDNDIFYTFH